MCASDDDEFDEEHEEESNIDDTINKNTIQVRDSSRLMSSDEPVERKHSNIQSHSSKVTARQQATYSMSRQKAYNKAYQQQHQGQFNRYSNDNNDNKYSLDNSHHEDHL